MKPIYQLYAAVILCLSLGSCEKVIKVNIKNSDPSIVITGAITNQPGPYTISVTKTVNFDANNTFPAVNDALVVVFDDLGNTDTFAAAGNGTYLSNSIAGTPGRTYTLSVFADGQQYTAVSKMPEPVLMDSLGIIEETGFGDPQKYPIVYYQDPAGKSNYYCFKEIRNGKLVKGIYARSDRFSDGKKVQTVLRNSDDELKPGDVVSVEMECVDKVVYDYFYTLQNVDGSTQTAAPADPLSNLSNNALGCFSAQTIEVRTVTVP